MQDALSPDWQHAIIGVNAGLLLIVPIWTNFMSGLGLQGLYCATNCIDNFVGRFATVTTEINRKRRLINETNENMVLIFVWKL